MKRAPRGWLRRPWAGAVCLLALVLVPALPVPANASVRPCAAGTIALTFDDGPSASQTPRLLGILRQKRVPATFFMVGERVRSAPAVARAVQRQGFVVANHTWSHPLLTRVSNRAVHNQLAAAANEFKHQRISPEPLMRPPYGGINARVRTVIEATGLVPVLWSVDSRDWAGGSSRQIADRILAGLRPHGQNVVLQHDGVTNSPASIGAVPLVVTAARRRGYCFTDLDARGHKRFPVRPLPDLSPTSRVVARPAPAPPVAAATRTLALDLLQPFGLWFARA